MLAYSLFGLILFAAARAHPQQVVPHSLLEQPAPRSLNDVDYRAYQRGDDLKLVKNVMPITCNWSSCWVAVASGTRTVVGVIEMTIPAFYIPGRVEEAIEAAMPEPGKKKPNGIIGYIDHVAVALSWRRKGIARKLLSTAFPEIGRTEPNVVAMYLVVQNDNVEAIGLYRSSGFVEILSDGIFIYFSRYDMT